MFETRLSDLLTKCLASPVLKASCNPSILRTKWSILSIIFISWWFSLSIWFFKYLSSFWICANSFSFLCCTLTCNVKANSQILNSRSSSSLILFLASVSNYLKCIQPHPQISHKTSQDNDEAKSYQDAGDKNRSFAAVSWSPGHLDWFCRGRTLDHLTI